MVSACVTWLRGVLKGRQLAFNALTQRAQAKKSMDASQQLIARKVMLKIERVKELILVRRLTRHGLHLRLQP